MDYAVGKDAAYIWLIKWFFMKQKPPESRLMKDTDCVQFGVIRISSWRS